jgi:hypothetical protein
MISGRELPRLSSFPNHSVKLPMDRIEEFLKPAIDLLPEQFREYWLVIVGTVALIILLPLAWYKRHVLRALLRLPRRQFWEEPKLDEDLAQFTPPQGLHTARRLFIEGVPARLRLVVAASLGKGTTINQSDMGEQLDKVRWGLGAMARQDQAAFRVWPVQLSANGFPAVFHRHIRKDAPDGQPSHWVLLSGPTPPRPHSVLLGLALWTDEATTIGSLTMDASQWMTTLRVENQENAAGGAVSSPSEHGAQPRTEDQEAGDNSQSLPKTAGGPSAS